MESKFERWQWQWQWQGQPKCNMEKKDNIEETSPALGLAILPRLERMDRLVHLVEERHGHGHIENENESECWSKCKCKRRPLLSGDVDDVINDNNKTLSSAMEEVHHKGTLMERLEMLENRVLQLWLEVEVEDGKSVSTSSLSVLNESQSAAAAAAAAAVTTGPTEPSNSDSEDRARGRRKWFNIIKLRRCCFH